MALGRRRGPSAAPRAPCSRSPRCSFLRCAVQDLLPSHGLCSSACVGVSIVRAARGGTWGAGKGRAPRQAQIPSPNSCWLEHGTDPTLGSNSGASSSCRGGHPKPCRQGASQRVAVHAAWPPALGLGFCCLAQTAPAALITWSPFRCLGAAVVDQNSIKLSEMEQLDSPCPHRLIIFADGYFIFSSL